MVVMTLQTGDKSTREIHAPIGNEHSWMCVHVYMYRYDGWMENNKYALIQSYHAILETVDVCISVHSQYW